MEHYIQTIVDEEELGKKGKVQTFENPSGGYMDGTPIAGHITNKKDPNEKNQQRFCALGLVLLFGTVGMIFLLLIYGVL